MLGFIFCHGWGYDPSFWENLKPYFQDYPCIFWDLGYFGPKDLPMPEPSSSIQWIGVGHSLGFLRLLNAQLPLHRLVGLQGFLNFQGNALPLNRKRARDFLKLQNAFKEDARTTLCEFHKTCGSHMRLDYSALNQRTLFEDLSLLTLTHPIREKLPCLILASEDDLIVTKELISDNFGQYNQVQIVMHNKGQHILGFSESEFVKNAIFNFLSDAQ